MKDNIFNLISTFMVMLFGLGVIGIVCWYTSKCSDEPIEKVSITVFTEKGHDYLVVDTKHGVCVIHAKSCPCRLDTLGIYVSDNNDTTYVIKKE